MLKAVFQKFLNTFSASIIGNVIQKFPNNFILVIFLFYTNIRNSYKYSQKEQSNMTDVLCDAIMQIN